MVNYFTHVVAQQRLLEMPPFKLMLDYKNLTKYPTLLSFGMKCEGKFVPHSPTHNVTTEHVQCTAAAGLGWWENRISSRLCQPIRGKL